MIRTSPPEDILRTIRLQRRNRRMSQSQLGSVLHMPQSHLARIETGASDVRLSTLTEIARALDLEPMLIPKQLVPAIRYMIDKPEQPAASAPRLVGNAPDELADDTDEYPRR